MQFKTLALATTSLVALGLAVAPATAASKMMGDVRLGFGTNWDDFEFGSEGSGSDQFDIQYQSILADGHVNLPYSDTVNIQLDSVARASLDESFFNGKNSSPSQTLHLGIGGHINYRNQEGLLGVFGAVGRTNDTFNVMGPFYLAGFEGQYFCKQWTFMAQLAYMDADEGLLLKNAGLIRVGTSYYPTNQFKIRAELAYMAGEQDSSVFSEPFADADAWAWVLGVDYWFGKSMPVSGFVEYRGRSAETESVSGSSHADLDVNAVNIGLKFHFGGTDLMDSDRNGASADLPDVDWYRLPSESFK